MPATVTLRRDIDPEDLLVIVLISSQHLTGIVALMSAEFGTKTIAYKRVEIPWHELEEREQRTAVGEIITKVCDSAGIEARSIYLARSEVSITSRTVVGDVSFEGILQPITQHEMDWALLRAQEKPVGTDQELIDIIPVKWECHGAVPRDGLKRGITVKLNRAQAREQRIELLQLVVLELLQRVELHVELRGEIRQDFAVLPRGGIGPFIHLRVQRHEHLIQLDRIVERGLIGFGIHLIHLGTHRLHLLAQR